MRLLRRRRDPEPDRDLVDEAQRRIVLARLEEAERRLRYVTAQTEVLRRKGKR